MTTRITATSTEDWVARLARIDQMILDAKGGSRIGEIIIVCDDTIPSYALECDGSAVSRTTYADLYDVLGDIYGSGDGSTTFNIPDYRGWFLRCADRAAGRITDYAPGARPDGYAGGSKPGVWYGQWLSSHSHGLNRPTNNITGGGGNNITGSGSNQNTNYSGGSEFRPRNDAVYYCIVHGAGG